VELLVLPAPVCSRGYKLAREGEDPKSLMEESNGVELDLVGLGFVPLYRASFLPFYRPRGRYRLHERENKEEKGFQGRIVLRLLARVLPVL
jgi:hypothetical protein